MTINNTENTTKVDYMDLEPIPQFMADCSMIAKRVSESNMDKATKAKCYKALGRLKFRVDSTYQYHAEWKPDPDKVQNKKIFSIVPLL